MESRQQSADSSCLSPTQDSLSIISYNMHGFHQGLSVVQDLAASGKDQIDIFLLQEHWLTPANLYKFDEQFAEYFCFGGSAMSKCVQSGILYGRPFGGVVTLVKKSLRKITETICSSERYTVIKVDNYVIFNVYLPCIGTSDRSLICDEVLVEIQAWRDKYASYHCIVAGDFNCDLNSSDKVVAAVDKFVQHNSLTRCDTLFPSDISATYVNYQLNHQSYIDYVLTSSPHTVNMFSVLDPDINFSDHLPLYCNIQYVVPADQPRVINRDAKATKATRCAPRNFRWDKADLVPYYYDSNISINEYDYALDSCKGDADDDNICQQLYVDRIYDNIVTALVNAALLHVPQHGKNFYKFWWNQELKASKAASVESNNLWKVAGKPRQGPIFEKRQRTRLVYRQLLRDEEKREKTSYTNDLHDALLLKNGKRFWSCWRSKFESSVSCSQVDGCVDERVIVDKFAESFQRCYTYNNKGQSEFLMNQYARTRPDYCGVPMSDAYKIDTELVSSVISQLQRGKAPDIEGLTAEHLQYCHPSVVVLLAKLFQRIMTSGCVPTGFKYSYIVPIPKVKDGCSKAMKCDDFRGIAISPIISKVFEYCLVDRFSDYLVCSDNQFGFKKGLSCNHAVYSTRRIVESIIKGGNTANLCSIDLSKAFDKVNHFGLYLKLMKRRIPVELLAVLENWLSGCFACVSWNGAWSQMFGVSFGVRQGSVLSPFLFNIYLDDLAKINSCVKRLFVVIYADDILLIAPSVTDLEHLLRMCETELNFLDMAINSSKSCCMRIGPRCGISCANISTRDGRTLSWASELRYLGIFIVKFRNFKCSLSNAKCNFYRAVNGIFSKILNFASEEVILELITRKCMPILLYGLESCQLSNGDLHSLDFTYNRMCMKLFKRLNIELIKEC